jgi:FMN-dependent NADH-azoreductase
MSTLLHLDSSPLPSSVTRELTREFVTSWTASHHNGKVIYRDLTATALIPVTAQWVGAAFTPVNSRTADQKAALALSDQLIAELEQADEYVFGVAMHNFSIPATLKLWIDQIARAGRTFAYSETGPEGLLKGKKATVIISTGGNYESGTPYASLNFVEPYLKTILGFIGVTNVEFVTASGAAQLMSPTADRQAFLKPSIDRVRSIAA